VVHRLAHAYPLLELGAEARVARMRAYLSRFVNLGLVGRNAAFAYGSLHHALAAARDLVEAMEPPALAERLA
jgi:hypothetical protein